MPLKLPVWEKYFYTTKTGGIVVPAYLAWDFPIRDGDMFASVKSRNKRKLLRKTTEMLQENNVVIHTETIASAKTYNELLRFYSTVNKAKGHEITRPAVSWYTRKKQQKRTAEAMRLTVRGKLVALKMYSYDKSGFYLSHKASLREWDEKMDIGTLLDYLSYSRAAELGYSVVKTGNTTNFFGLPGGLPLSLLKYKVSIGCIPRPVKDKKTWRLQPTLTEKPEGPCVFFGERRNVLQGFVVAAKAGEANEHTLESCRPTGFLITVVAQTKKKKGKQT